MTQPIYLRGNVRDRGDSQRRRRLDGGGDDRRRSATEFAESRDAVIHGAVRVRTIIRKPLAAGRNYDAKLVARLVSFMNVRNAAIILL